MTFNTDNTDDAEMSLKVPILESKSTYDSEAPKREDATLFDLFRIHDIVDIALIVFGFLAAIVTGGLF